jgi:coproporphyrinogen III oxidase
MCVLFKSHVMAAIHWWFGGGFDMTPYYGLWKKMRALASMAKDAV